MKELSYLYGETTCFSANFTFVNTFAVVLSEETRRIVAGWSIMFTCVGAFLLSYAASSLSFPGYPLCGVGGCLLLAGLIALSSIDQDDARHTFGHSGGNAI
jgi:cationic amino acid transporter 1